jgi:feruloyl esterase
MKPSNIFRCSAVLGAAHALDCSTAAFTSILGSNGTVTYAYPLPENSTFQVPAGDIAFPQSPAGLPSLCVVAIEVPSDSNASYSFGLFLPDTWNGRFLYVRCVQLY